MDEVCAKCGSEKLIWDATAIDRGDYNSEGELSVGVDEKPSALIFKQRMRSNVSAVVCGECGYIEFYAENPEILYQAYQNRAENAE